MLIPYPMPDEVARGHFGRITFLNALEPGPLVLHILNAYLRMPNGNGRRAGRPLLNMLAMACNIEPSFYASQHSMLPFLRVAARQGQKIFEHGSPDDEDVVRRNGMLSLQGAARACVNCMREDQGCWGFCYWRRIHQIEGVTWCFKHDTPLTVVTGGSVLDVPPDHWVDAEALVVLRKDAISMEHPAVRRYGRIVLGILDRKMPISGHEASVKIRLRAKLLGLRIDKRGSGKNLSDLVRETLPVDWLQAHFPALPRKKCAAHFAPIDKICFSSTPAAGLAYAAALASMFESSEDALSYFDRRVDMSMEPRKYTHYGECFWKSEKVLKIYSHFGGNHFKIAKALNIRSTTVKNSLSQNCLPGLGTLKKESRLAALDFLSGKSIEESCAQHGANRAAVEKLIRAGASHLKDALSKQAILS